jgi:hypothetical protein
MQVGAKSKSCGFPSDFLSKVSEHDKPLRAEDWTGGKKRLDRSGKAECSAMDKESRLIPKTVVVENVEIWCISAGDEMTSASSAAKGRRVRG